MTKTNLRAKQREQRRLRIRDKISGTPECPRLAVYRSAKQIYCQLIDDHKGVTLASCSTLDKELKGKVKATVAGSKEVGKLLAKRALQKGVQNVVLDRGGFRYHGQIKALADAAREGGLKF